MMLILFALLLISKLAYSHQYFAAKHLLDVLEAFSFQAAKELHSIL